MDEQQEAPPAAASDDLATTLASLTAERDEARTALAASRESYAGAMTQLLAAARSGNPTIPGDLIVGETPEDITASIARGLQIRDAVLTANVANPGANGHAVVIVPHVPAGGHAAPPPATDTMTALQKVTFGLQQRRDAARQQR